MASFAILKDMGYFLGISDSSKGTRGVTVWYISLFPNLRIIHHFVPLFNSICTLTSRLMFNTWGISLYVLFFRISIKLVLLTHSKRQFTALAFLSSELKTLLLSQSSCLSLKSSTK